jgi:MOSC domain-containing protein YiiM
MQAVEKAEIIAGQGISGDASFGREKRQILLVSERVLNHFQLKPGDIRENLVIADLDVDSIQTGTQVRVGSVTIEISGACTPCSKLDHVRPGLQHELVDQRGVLARALTDGEISIGDLVEIV